MDLNWPRVNKVHQISMQFHESSLTTRLSYLNDVDVHDDDVRAVEIDADADDEDNDDAQPLLGVVELSQPSLPVLTSTTVE